MKKIYYIKFPKKDNTFFIIQQEDLNGLKMNILDYLIQQSGVYKEPDSLNYKKNYTFGDLTDYYLNQIQIKTVA